MAEERKQNKEKCKKINLVGAPCKYKREYAHKMISFFEKFVEDGEPGMPQFGIFAVKFLRVTPQTLLNWCDEYPEFDEAYKLCKEIQRDYLVSRGLSGKNNPRMTQFVLSSCFKMSEYARKKPSEERAEIGLSEGDRALISAIEKRLTDKSEHTRPSLPEGGDFGAKPYDDADDDDEDE